VLPEATVVEPNGAAVIGSRGTVRDSDFVDTSLQVTPGDGDLRTGRISRESPPGAALLGRRAARKSTSLRWPGRAGFGGLS
jgi:transcription elongation GreA/GreB family factor